MHPSLKRAVEGAADWLRLSLLMGRSTPRGVAAQHGQASTVQPACRVNRSPGILTASS